MSNPTETFALPLPDGRLLRGRLDLPPNSGDREPWVLVAHGFSSFLEWGFYPALTARLNERGIACLRFNFSSHGIGEDLQTFVDPEVFAHATYTRELEDLAVLRRAVDDGRFPALDPGRAGLLGHSRGGGMGLVHAAEDGRYRAVATWAAIDAILRFSPRRIAQWREDGELMVFHHTARRAQRLAGAVLRDAEQNRERLDIQAACGRLRCPLLVAQGTEDNGVLVSAAEALMAASPPGQARLLLADGGDHVFGARHPLTRIDEPLATVLNETVAWFARHLDVAGALG